MCINRDFFAHWHWHLVAAQAGSTIFGQAVRGHTQIMLASKPVASLVQDEDIPPEVRRKLVLSQKIRKFATAELALPDNGSYLRYARIDRPYVMWNVFASAELSFDAHSWCYPVVGCLSYRGYYDRSDATELADKLQAQGADVYVAPVAAYSTLGWFADPLISPMMRWPDEELARVIFHELAHQQRYIRDDTELNEAYATALAEIALLAWGQGRAEICWRGSARAQTHEGCQFYRSATGYQKRAGRDF